MIIRMDRELWEIGVRDGAEGRPGNALLMVPGKARSYCSGYIEGKAYRDGFTVTTDVVEIAERPRERALVA